MDYQNEYLVSCQWVLGYGEIATVADDFQFAEETTMSCARWIGGYYEGNDGDFDWTLAIFDNGANDLPNQIIAGPIRFNNSIVNETFIGEDDDIFYY